MHVKQVRNHLQYCLYLQLYFNLANINHTGAAQKQQIHCMQESVYYFL